MINAHVPGAFPDHHICTFARPCALFHKPTHPILLDRSPPSAEHKPPSPSPLAAENTLHPPRPPPLPLSCRKQIFPLPSSCKSSAPTDGRTPPRRRGPRGAAACCARRSRSAVGRESTSGGLRRCLRRNETKKKGLGAKRRREKEEDEKTKEPRGSKALPRQSRVAHPHCTRGHTCMPAFARRSKIL